MDDNHLTFKRLFIAIQLDDTKYIHLLINNLKSNLLDEKILWVQSKNLHLTLKFLGKTNVNFIDKIDGIIKKCCEEINEFSIEYGRIGIFGSKHSPKVVWLEAKTNGILEALEKNLSSSLVDLGFLEDRQNFVPHLTLARIHNPLKSKAYFQKVLEKFNYPVIPASEIKKIHLFSSRLTSEGPFYTIEKTYNLRNDTN